MTEVQNEGKIRWIGVSNFSVHELQKAGEIASVTSVQPPYSLIHREIQKDLLPFCQREDIGVIAYSPMASGLLAGAMTRERVANLPADDWRRQNPEFQEPNLSQNLALVERLRTIGARHGKSTGEVAISWTLRHPAVTGAIVGARSTKQVDGIIDAATFRLTPAEIQEIDAER
jgi:aryl-alcohol dehydrogenase-like predicted oxidoreductase